MAMAAVSKGRHMRDASFSSYLDTADTDFVRSLAASIHGSSPIFTPSRHSSSPSPCPSPMTSKRQPRRPLGELGVFGAEGYFSEKLDNDRTPSVRSIEDQVSQMKHGNKPRTPSIRSESSTDQIRLKKSVGGTSWFLAGLQCKGSCYDVKQQQPVMVKQPSSTNRLRKGFWEDQVVHINNSKKQPACHSLAVLEDPRKSIEVFGSGRGIPKEEDDESSIFMERNLSMLSWDAIPVASQQKTRISNAYEMESDASSDLFDIAVFPAEEMSPVTAPYEPSEASIEWSVVTASAADFSTVSDHVDDIPPNNLKPKPKEAHSYSQRRSGGILGCRSDKTVKVVAPSSTRMASYPPIPPKKTTTTITPFSPSSSSSAARAPRAIHMY